MTKTLLIFMICGSFLSFSCSGAASRIIEAFFGIFPADPPDETKLVRSATSNGVASSGNSIYIAASAHAKGGNGTNWRTDIGLHARSTGAVQYRVELLKHGTNNSSPPSRDLSIAAGTCVQLDDVLATEFDYDGSAALRITPSEGRLVVASRTYNLLGAGNPLDLPAGSTFGQFIPALGTAGAIAFGEKGRLIQLSHNPEGTEGFRSNLGLVNTTDRSIRVEAELFKANGIFLGTVVTNLVAFEYRQINSVLQRVSDVVIEDAYAIVKTTTSGGGFLAYASVVDNRTGDPVAMMAEPIQEQPGGTSIYVVAAADVAGAGETNWRTDLEVHNPGTQAVTFGIEMLLHGQANLLPQSASFTLSPGISRRFQDVLDGVFSFSGQAALRITPMSGNLLVSSRTYNLLLEGNDLGLPGGSTFGQFIASASVEEAISDTDEGILVQLASDSASRTNLVLVSTNDTPMAIETDLYDGAGNHLGRVNTTLAPYEYRQINRVFKRVTNDAVSAGYAAVRTTTEQAAFFALASVVDNNTGDPVAVPAARIAVGERKDPDAMVSGLFDVFSDYQADETFNIEMFASLWLDRSIDTLLGELSEQMPNATYQGKTLIIDYGNGNEDEDGNVISGSISTDFSGINIGSDTISGTILSTSQDYIVNGQRSLTDWVEWDVDLNIDAEGAVNGQLSVEGGAFGILKSAEVSMSGSVDIDTVSCLYYPTGGTVTIVIDGIEYTYTFTPGCDGTYETGDEPGETVFLNFDELAPFTVVSDQYPEARFSSAPGLEVKAFPISFVSPPNSLAIFDGDELYEEPNTDFYIDFPNPVGSLVVNVWDVKTVGHFGRIWVYQGATLAGTVDMVGVTGTEEEALTIDLSAFLHVTRVELQYLDEENDTVFWDDISFVVE